jgi:hypothetical protein
MEFESLAREKELNLLVGVREGRICESIESGLNKLKNLLKES